jgi:succinyl-CoA:acetate CoA-transferase
MLTERIRNKELLKKVVSPEAAASLLSDGMAIGTSGDAKRGFATAFFGALADRAKQGACKDLSLWSSSVLDGVEGMLAEAGALKRRFGSHGNATLRKQINSGKVLCNDLRGEMVSIMARSKILGKLDFAVVDAVAITEEGFIVPSHTPIDIGSLVEAADKVIIEIDGALPSEIEGMYDHYLPELHPYIKEIPLYNAGQRIGTPYIPIAHDKISCIVISNCEKTGAKPMVLDERSDRLAEHLVEFFEKEVKYGRLPRNLYPVEVGLGSIADAIMKNLADRNFDNLEIFSAVIGDGVIDLIDSGKCRAATGSGMLVSDNGWEKFCKDIEKFKRVLIMRPLEIVDHPEIVRRLRLIAINGAIEADIYGHINSSHIGGVNLVNGVGGSPVFASNAYLSIFPFLSTNNTGNVSMIVPMVSHVDNTEHCVDVIVTEIGLADLRGLSPVERAEVIIENCAHPDYRPLLREYFEKAKKTVGGHEPHILEEAFSFHQRLKQQKTMKNHSYQGGESCG